jgi:glutathione S-transferase
VSDAHIVLWHIEISHYNEKVRWALDYKGIPYELRTPLPGLHRATALRLTRGKHDRLPIAEIGRERIGDSTAIIAAVEAAQPDPPLYPQAGPDRERALTLEDYFDEELAPRLRRFVWHHTLDDTDATVDTVFSEAGPARKRVMRALAPIVRPIVKRDYHVAADTAAEAADGMRAAMDRIESELGSGDYLVGDSFSVADLTAAALFTPVLAPPGRQYQPPGTPPGVLAMPRGVDGATGRRLDPRDLPAPPGYLGRGRRLRR